MPDHDVWGCVTYRIQEILSNNAERLEFQSLRFILARVSVQSNRAGRLAHPSSFVNRPALLLRMLG
jgi:hypothetical protein